jgi:hypothetical protein
MGTRSTIALEFADGTVQQVYCHWDGYLEHNGKILQEHYSDPFKLRELIDLGDLSSLRPNIGEKHAFSQFELPADEVEAFKALTEDMCTFYGRDRNESGCEARKFKDYLDYAENHQYEEYEYILRACGDKAVWFVSDHGKDFVPLTEALEVLFAEEAA